MMGEQPTQPPADDPFVGPLGALIRTHDWSRTTLGPLARWPRSLRSYVSMILSMPSPAIIFWGPDQIQLYNEGYAVIMGPRHPKYLGAPYRECWPDTYPTIHPWMQGTLAGEVIEVEDTPFTLTRHGFNEETYFTFSFSPLRDDHDRVAGILQPVVETTQRVLGDRRLETLRALAPAENAGGAPAQRVALALGSNAKDIPFSLLYLWDETAKVLVPASSSGLESAPRSVPDEVGRAFKANAMVEIEPVDAMLGGPQTGPWDEPTARAVALPLRRTDPDQPSGVIVLGVSPRLRYDDKYRQFFEAVAREISATIDADQARLSRLDVERAQKNLHEFFMQTPTPLAILGGPEHKFVLSNRSYFDLVGVEVEGKRVVDMFPSPETVAPFIRILDRVYANGEPFVGRELPFLRPRKDGGTDDLLVNVSFTPLRGRDGAVTGILVFAYDITQEVVARRHAETLAAELEKAVRARDDFLGIASHELRTPLTALRLQLQLNRRTLTELPTAEGQAKMLDGFLKQTERLSRLVEDMLDIARISAGRLLLELVQGDLSALVADVLDRFEPQLAAVGTAVRRDLTPSLVGAWDGYRLEQVVTNLITNVLRYAPGTPLHVTTRREDDRAVLEVRDHGPGIAPENQERIFGRFERATGKEVSGLGLGLFIARQIVEGHGGTILAETAEGGGARFLVRLPLRASKG